MLTAVLALLCTGPLSPFLSDLGTSLNPFEGAKHGLKIVVIKESQDINDGWIVAKPWKQIGKLPGPKGSWNDWEKQENAIRANKMVLRLSLQGGSAKSIIIERLDIEVVQRRQPATGTFVVEPGAGDLRSRYFMVNLDDPSGRPKPKAFAPKEGNIEGDLTDFPYKVSESDVEHVMLFVYTRECDCEWKGVLYWTVDGTQGETEILDGGRPFRLTASTGATTRAVFQSAVTQPVLTPAPLNR